MMNPAQENSCNVQAIVQNSNCIHCAESITISMDCTLRSEQWGKKAIVHISTYYERVVELSFQHSKQFLVSNGEY